MSAIASAILEHFGIVTENDIIHFIIETKFAENKRKLENVIKRMI